MRLDTPRLPPLRDDELDAEQAEMVARFRKAGADFGLSRTFVRHPASLRAYNAWATHAFSSNNTLTPREREIVIMRTVWRCKAAYQWSRHVGMGMRDGLTMEEIEALKRPVEQGGWAASDAALIACVDALTADHFVNDELWAELSSHFDDQQCMDAILVCGRYVMASMLTNTLGTPIDHDVKLDPELDLRGRPFVLS